MTIELQACTYSYRRWRAPILNDFTYTIPHGLTVLLGPNGAGKSTLLKIAAGVERPRSGTVTLDGIPSYSKAFRTTVAWMPQHITPVPGLNAREYVAYVGWLKGMTKADAWERAAHALARVQLTESSTSKVNQLSGGQLRRVGVACALVHEARVLLLDEPTAGMDPAQRRRFRDVLNTLVGDVAVLMSTHDVADLAEEADTVTVLNKGRVVSSGTAESFLALAPAGVAPGRLAEAAYTALLTTE